ncbi:hypothetical protein AB7092_22320 [Providencia rettgeri]
MTEEQIVFFQQQLRLLVNTWWKREVDDFHGNFDKGINKLNDLVHVSTGLIELHRPRAEDKKYWDNAKTRE